MNTGNNPLISNHRIAHYRIMRKLGQGGMSIVYEGFDERLKRPVALKVLHPFLAEGPEYRSRFFREAEAVARLTHPNIVQIFDVSSAETKDDQLYIVTELLTGVTLKEFSTQVNFFELPELSAMIIWQIALALDHAHQRGIIHRDIKPENIMIGHDGQIKLMDFGIASVGNEESITQSGTILGSLAHLSPEVIKGQRATAESDIFSLTTVFYRMLTNELPFVGDSPHALLKAIVDDPHKKVQLLSPFITDELADIVERGMHKEPSNRYKSPQAMAEAIESALSVAGVAIDIREMQTVLKKPETFEHFKLLIIEQIKKQIDLYQGEKNEAGALALSCRLDATKMVVEPTSELSKPRAKKIFIQSILAALLVIGVLVALPNIMPSQNTPSIQPSHDASSALTHKEAVVVQEHTEAKEEILEPPPMAQPPVATPEKLATPPVIVPSKDKPDNKVVDLHKKQEVQFVIWPFANVSVDGKMVAQDQKSITIMLDPGVHRVLFTHTYAAQVEKVIKVTQIEEPIKLSIELNKSKPALLVVKSDIDGDIAVDRGFRGTVKRSMRQPIVIPMPDRTHAQTKEVMISEKGYKPIIIDVEFVAGQIEEIDAQFVPLDKDNAQTVDEHVIPSAKRLY